MQGLWARICEVMVCVRDILDNLFLSAHRVWSYRLGVRAILVTVGRVFPIYWQTLEIVFVRFDPRELVCALLDLDSWLASRSLFNCTHCCVVL